MFLTDAFPIEAGEINSDERVLPKLSGQLNHPNA
jgi:hypothetical protein